MIGVQIENYKILSQLGVGGMGTVYKAMDVNLERVVALKLLNAGLAQNPDLEARFRAEARAQATLNHANIATLYTILTWEGKAVMVMEYVEGRTLQESISAHGAMPALTALALCKQALHGVGAAHRQGIVHRDLKPANLMMNSEGVLKVMDFGIAKIKGGAGLTRTAAAIGTCLYMAPEQVLGKTVDARTDIYSMGITLYEMLTGEVPFNFDSEFAVQQAHVQQPPASPTVHNRLIAPAVAEVVLRAIEKDPACRFQSAEEFIRAIPRVGDTGQVAVVQGSGNGGTVWDGASHAGNAQGASPSDAGRASAQQRVSRPPVGTEFVQEPLRAADVRQEVHGPPTGKNRGVMLGGVGIVALAAVLGLGWKIAKPKAGPPATESVPVAQVKQAMSAGPTKITSSKATVMPSVAGTHTTNVPVGPQPVVVQPPPKTDTTVKQVDPPLESPKPVPTAETSFAGHWTGAYQDSAKLQADTSVNIALRETKANTLGGTVDFTTADKESGQCSISDRSTYDPQSRRLTLLITNACTGAKPPMYFKVPTTFSNVTPEDKRLPGGHLYGEQTLSAHLVKSGS